MSNNHMPTFSIIIPVYNVEKYIDTCIESVLGQTYCDFEVILVDDGSTDDSYTICMRYQHEHPDKLHLLHQKNQGQLIARRNAICLSKGKILVFLDADDYLRQDALHVIWIAMKTYNCDLLMFTCMKFGESQAASLRVYPYSNGQTFEGCGKETLYKAIITGNSINNLAFKAVKRSLVDIDASYEMYRHVICANDLFQVLPILRNAKKCVYIDEPIYYYRRGHQSTTSTFRWEKYYAYREVDQRIFEYMRMWKLDTVYLTEYRVRCLENIYLIVIGVRLSKAGSDNFRTAVNRYHEIANDLYFISAYNRCATRFLKPHKFLCLFMLKNHMFACLYFFSGISELFLKEYVSIRNGICKYCGKKYDERSESLVLMQHRTKR